MIFNYFNKLFTSKSKTIDDKTKSITKGVARYQAVDIVNDLLINSASWLSLNDSGKYIKSWEEIADLRTVISKISNYFLRVDLKHYKITNDGLEDITEDSSLIQLFENPNPLQNKNEFLEELYTYWNVCGNNYTYFRSSSGFDSDDYNRVKAMYNINPALIEPNLKKNIFTELNLKDIIESYDYNQGRYSKPLKIENILHINDVNLNKNKHYIRGNSKLNSLVYQLTNLGIAYEAKNVLLSRRGAIGMFTAGKGNEHGFPLTTDEQQTIQKQWSDYGITRDQWQVIFTKAALVWQQIAMPTKDLMIYEGLEDDRQSLCSAFSLPYLLFKSEGAGSTYANLDTASKQIYREKIISDWRTLEAGLNKHFKLKEKNELLKFDYSNIDVLQEDENTKIEKQKNKTIGINEILIKYNNNELSEVQAKTELEFIWNLPDGTIDNLLSKPEQTENIENNIEEVSE